MSSNTENPLVSIGIPTFNRPKGLRIALEKITVQTYLNLEIIISDNHSDNKEEIDLIVQKFNDKRIKLFRQETNIGSIPNFEFVLKQSTGTFFMWAADDDYFDSNNLVEKLLAVLSSEKEVGMAFPDFNYIESSGKITGDLLFKRYNSCNSKNDYIKALCRSGIGHPMYGLFRKELLSHDLVTLFSKDIVHFNEGVFLHAVFLKTLVKFVPGVYITYLGSDIFDKRNKAVIVKDFLKYWYRIIRLYTNSVLEFKTKVYCITYLCGSYLYATLRFVVK